MKLSQLTKRVASIQASFSFFPTLFDFPMTNNGTNQNTPSIISIGSQLMKSSDNNNWSSLIYDISMSYNFQITGAGT
jgi:hypothetical protein